MTPFDAYQCYHAIKMHFESDSYDYFKYYGKTRLKYSSYEKNRSKYFYEKLAKNPNCKELILSNIVYRDVAWVRDLLTPEADDCLSSWLAINRNLTYFICREIETLEEKLIDHCKVKSGQHPQFLKDMVSGRASIETLVVLDSTLGIFDIWDRKIQDPIIWPNLHKKMLKYKPFLQYDQSKVKKTLKEVMNHLKDDINNPQR